MKRLAILGSTGSIGRNALKVAGCFPEKFSVTALSAKTDTETLCRQVRRWRPEFVGVGDKISAARLSAALGHKRCPKLFIGQEGLRDLARRSEIEEIVLAISGAAALGPLWEAARAGKRVALANKEALVMAGGMIMDLARRNKSLIIPIDSEQSAIWQCLQNQGRRQLKRIYLTASGGPLLKKRLKDLKCVSPETVLRHPRWNMGKKITVDSATLMNKGLEVLEAMFLFGVGPSDIEVVIHPEAIIHSMVEFGDAVVLAQLSRTDMRIPIQYALSYPERLANALPRLDFFKLKALHFEKPDLKRFPCLGVAYRAARQLGSLPAVMNAANEICVEAFLAGRIDFMGIPRVIEKVMDRHRNILSPDLQQILESDQWARVEAQRYITRKDIRGSGTRD